MDEREMGGGADCGGDREATPRRAEMPSGVAVTEVIAQQYQRQRAG